MDVRRNVGTNLALRRLQQVRSLRLGRFASMFLDSKALTTIVCSSSSLDAKVSQSVAVLSSTESARPLDPPDGLLSVFQKLLSFVVR